MLGRNHALAITLATSVVFVSPVTAKPRCRHVVGGVVSELVTGPECSSPLGLCSRGRLTGDIRESFFFTLLTLTATAATPETGVMHYTGEMVIETRRGVLVLDEVGAFDVDANGTGDVAAVSSVLGGGTGRLRIQGTFTAQRGGRSWYVGELCTE